MENIQDLYTDYLLSSFGQVTSTGLSLVLDLKEDDPCESVQEQFEDENFKEKFNELEGFIDLYHEKGYYQDRDEGIKPEREVAYNETTYPDVPTVFGVMHLHPKDSVWVEDGKQFTRHSYKMPSQKDIHDLLDFVKNSYNHNNHDFSDTYMTVISEYGNYTLKFTGDINEIDQNDFDPESDDMKEDYKKYFDKKYSNKEKAFLHFLKDKIGIPGIEVYKIKTKSNGELKKVQKISLKINGGVKQEKCD